MKKLAIGFGALVLAGVGGSVVAQQPANAPAPASDPRASFMSNSYLGMANILNSLKLNPPPPAKGSLALLRDEEAAGAAVALRDSPRWEQAKIDADLFTADATANFSCAAGFTISALGTPRLNELMRKAAADLAASTYPTKRAYMRPRPFTVNGSPTCTPDQEGMLRQDGAYPSGHSAIGYGWGLILAEIVPTRAVELVARGRAFGDSRRVCNVHWLSDVEEGRVVATAVVARLHADNAFQRDLKKARDEISKKRGKLAVPDCMRENAALGTS